MSDALQNAQNAIGDKKPAQILVPISVSKTMPSFIPEGLVNGLAAIKRGFKKVPFIGKLVSDSKPFKRAHFTTLEINIDEEGKVSATHIDSAGKRIGGLYNTDHIKKAVQQAFPDAEYKDVYTGHQGARDSVNCGRFSVNTIEQRMGQSIPVNGPQDILKPDQKQLEAVDQTIQEGTFISTISLKPQVSVASEITEKSPTIQQPTPRIVANMQGHNPNPPHNNATTPPTTPSQGAGQVQQKQNVR
jgi:hypothetical protein